MTKPAASGTAETQQVRKGTPTPRPGVTSDVNIVLDLVDAPGSPAAAARPHYTPGTHALSVDMEEWFHVGAFETVIDPKDWPSLDSRVDKQVNLLLNLFDDHDAKATFFCLGWVAVRQPALIKRIYHQGHEIACHGLNHRRVTSLTQQAFRAQTQDAKKILEDLIGGAIIGYRAPSFSIDRSVPWVYEQLMDMGFRYSSSIFPIDHDHYGDATQSRTPYWAAASLLEIPMTTCRSMGRNWPAAGGGYFRLLPYMLGKGLLSRASRQLGCPAVFYTHPWEYDPGQPFVKDAPLKSRLRHYVGQRRMEQKLSRLLDAFEWGTVEQVIFSPLAHAGVLAGAQAGARSGAS